MGGYLTIDNLISVKVLIKYHMQLKKNLKYHDGSMIIGRPSAQFTVWKPHEAVIMLQSIKTTIYTNVTLRPVM